MKRFNSVLFMNRNYWCRLETFGIKTEKQFCWHFYMGGSIISSIFQLFNISYQAWNGVFGLSRK